MEARIDRESATAALKLALDATAKATDLPILGTVRLSAQGEILAISATDSEVFYRVQLPARVDSPGETTSPAKPVFEALKAMWLEPVTLKHGADDSEMEIIDEVSSYRLPTLDPADFPPDPQIPTQWQAEVEAGYLAEVLPKILKAMAKEAAGPLADLHIEAGSKNGEPGLTLAATDGHRLHLNDFPVDADEDWPEKAKAQLPARGAKLLAKLAGETSELSISLGDDWFFAKAGASVLGLRLPNYSYPDYRVVVPAKTKFKATMNRITLLGIAKAAKAVQPKGGGLVITPGPEGAWKFSAMDTGLGSYQASLDQVRATGKPDEPLGLNRAYLEELLSPLASEEITLAFNSPRDAVMITGLGDPGFAGIIMPMKV